MFFVFAILYNIIQVPEPTISLPNSFPSKRGPYDHSDNIQNSNAAKDTVANTQDNKAKSPTANVAKDGTKGFVLIEQTIIMLT